MPRGHSRFGGARFLSCALRVAAILVVPVLFGAGVEAQQLFNMTPEQLQQLQQNNGLSGAAAGAPQGATSQQPILLQPAVPPQAATDMQASRLEQIMSARAGTPLRQFGYDQLGRSAAVMVPQTGAVQDDYVLGPGDEIVVTMRGQENNERRAVVDRNGQITLPRLGPISASGRSLGSFTRDLQSAVQRAYVATDASVSVARMRQISVLVTGAVNNPGMRLLTGLSSALDAILISGGIAKSGSLRDVRIVRAGRQFSVDFYSILAGGRGTGAMRLADGDRIFVAPLGRTVAAAGLVRTPGIYELAPGQVSITAQALISLAGGQEVNGSYLYSLLRLQPDGRTALLQLKNTSEAIRDGEVLALQMQADQTTMRVTLSGGTALAGSYPLATGTKLSEIIRRPGALGISPYTLFGFVSRRDPRTLLRTITAFTPAAVMAGGEDLILQPDDIVRPISVDEMRMLVTTAHDYDQWRAAQEEAVRNPISTTNVGADAKAVKPDNMAIKPDNGDGVTGKSASATGGVQGQVVANGIANAANSAADSAASEQDAIEALAGRASNRSRVSGQAGAAGPQSDRIPAPNFLNQTTSPGVYEQNREATTFVQLAQQLGMDPLVVINFLIGNQVTIDGAVRGPGVYFVGPSVTLQDLVLAAGGTMNWVDASGVELISTFVDSNSGRAVTKVTRLPLTAATLSNHLISPRDSFRFNEVFTDVNVGSATVQGEVRFAGNYKLTRGERLSDLLTRAGGLTNAAYPYGTVFLRKSVAALEQEGFARAAREVEDQLVVAMTRVGNNKIDPQTFAAMQSFVTDLRTQKALGRIAMTADPSVLAANPAQDPLLESGDVIYIPPRPATVSVLGQVMQPGSFPYQAGASVADYIGRAGGYSRLADESDVFVVLPDGTARKFEKSWLRFNAGQALPPGSAVVVPRDVTPLDLRQTIIDLSQILSQLAVSIASVAVLSK